MAVEDFPIFPEWVASLDSLVVAKDRLLAAIKAERPEHEMVAARRDVTLAQSRFDDASSEIGYA